MSYQVLARKWRPRDFASLVGQEHVVRALRNALTQQRLHHAYLLTGTRGVGKTTLARILAKCLNCETGITGAPCGRCAACTEIDGGRFVDYVEMDAASNRGVDEMTQLLERAIYAPTSGRFKVYVIDEVHQLSGHAFNAMLKTLEEPPEHMKFILATTDPQKVPVTVLSRCLQFNLKQMPPGADAGHLQQIAAAEKVDAEPQALRMLDALIARDARQMLTIADEMAERSFSFSQALRDLGSLLHWIALAQQVPDAIGDDVDEADSVRRLAQQMAPDEVQLCYQIALHGRNDLGLAPDEYAGFTMTLLRMLAFAPVETE